MKKPKRECPRCGHGVQVISSITTAKTSSGSEKYQRIRCEHCGLTGSTSQKEVITWDDADLRKVTQT